jgi:Domain of unknown function (DUF4194)
MFAGANYDKNTMMDEILSDNPTEAAAPAPDSFAPLAIRLLKGVIYEEDARLWNDLLKVHEQPLRQYFAQIGLQLVINRNDGFAFLRQPPASEEGTTLPRLMSNRVLTLDQSVLCVLLRECLEEYTVTDATAREPVLSLRDIREMVELFFNQRSTQQRFLRDVKKTVKEVKDMGFLDELSQPFLPNEDDTRYRVKRILKAFIGADQLQELFQQLTQKTHENT